MVSDQPTPEQLAAAALHPCPVCGQPTDSLKQYGFVKYFLVFFAVAVFGREDHVACPSCMRKYLLSRSLFNVIPVNVALSIVLLIAVKAERTTLHIFLANIVLLFAFLPWLVVLIVATTKKGHSKSIRARE